MGILEAINDGRFSINNFQNKDLKNLLIEEGLFRAKELIGEVLKKISAKVTRFLAKLKVHKLIAKISRGFRYRITVFGLEIIYGILRIRKLEILAAG